MANLNVQNVRIILKNDTAAKWATSTLVLKKGELALESDTGKFKFGDGVHKFSEISSYGGCIVSANADNGFITIDGVKTKVYELPIGSTTTVGGVKSGFSDAQGADNTGKVQIGNDGTLTLALVDKANKLAQAITLSIDGDVTGSTTTDGSANATITVALPTQQNIDTTKSYTKVRFNAKGIAVSGDESITLSDVSDAGTAASKNTGTAAGNVPILGVDGKLDTAVLPALATGETKVVADDAARFALTTADVQEGDVVIVTGTQKTYFVIDSTKLSVEAGYAQVLTPDAPVQSVNGKTGVVTLDTDDVSEGSNNLYYTDARVATKVATMNTTDMADGATVLHTTDALILDGGDSTDPTANAGA